MKNSKHLNVGLSITVIVCAFMMLLSYDGIGALMSKGKFDWRFGSTYLIFMLGGIFAIFAKVICCAWTNFKDKKRTTYAIVGLIFDCLCAIGFVLIFVVFIMRAAEVTNVKALESMQIIYILGLPLSIVTSICGLYTTKRCYAK